MSPRRVRPSGNLRRMHGLNDRLLIFYHQVQHQGHVTVKHGSFKGPFHCLHHASFYVRELGGGRGGGMETNETEW